MLWKLHVFPHVIQSDTCKSCFLLRYHHSILDGVNIMRLLLKYTGSPEEPKHSEKKKTKRMSSCQFAGKWLRSFAHILFAPRDKRNPLNDAPRMTASSPRHIVYRTMDTSVAAIKRLKSAGFTVNDVLISCLTSVFASFATQRHTQPLAIPVHVGVGADCHPGLRLGLHQAHLLHLRADPRGRGGHREQKWAFRGGDEEISRCASFPCR